MYSIYEIWREFLEKVFQMREIGKMTDTERQQILWL